jgi:hypothetical protein
MTTLTLLVKAKHAGQLKQVDEHLKSKFEDLDVEVQVTSNPVNRWIQVDLLGEDETIATSYINKEFGTCPGSLKHIEASSVLKGYISKIDTNKPELKVDVGVFEPKVAYATIPLACLQTQLLNGRDVGLKKIMEIYGLAEGLPLRVKASYVNSEGQELQAELSADQVEKFHFWQQSLLDRLIILGASEDAVKVVLERTRLNRDVIEVEALGMFEHALTCKLGTDAAGLIPRVGRYMRNSILIVFDAEKSLNFWMNKD